MAYVGKKSCGCIVAFVVDEPEYPRDTAREVAEFIRSGLTVERVTVEESRKIVSRCIHRRPDGQPLLGET